MKEYLQKLCELGSLTQLEAKSAMNIIMEGGATDAQIAAFLFALKAKGEAVSEISGFVEVMREKAIHINVDDPNAIDMCGTGGDGSMSFNISTLASIVVAGGGVTVAKHGNRAVSSLSGSAGILKALGVNIELEVPKTEACVNSIGIGFLYAPLFHPAMKHVAKVRSELGVRTVFNLLGPLTNPAGVERQLLGVFNKKVSRSITDVMTSLKPDHVCVVYSLDGLDEVSLGANTVVREIKKKTAPRLFEIEPSSFGLNQSPPSSVRGDSPEHNAKIALTILQGEKSPYRDYVVANAAAGFYVAGKVETIQGGVPLAQESIDSGRALEKLKQLIEFTNR
ncbi:MAG: anthranilate phosphoribosyltransferase [Ignavibacteriae bacterium]|nr:anthranilate phosphoribosyltransferase [Ignavibacteriota bacterium]